VWIPVEYYEYFYQGMRRKINFREIMHSKSGFVGALAECLRPLDW
jgi:hypothetical protein